MHLGAIVVLSCCAAAAGNDTVDDTLTIETAKQAVDIATQYVGAEIIDGCSDAVPKVCAELVEIHHKDTLAGANPHGLRRTWVVSFDSVFLEFDSGWHPSAVLNQRRKTFMVLIDAGSGHLSGIIAGMPPDTADITIPPVVPRSGKVAGLSWKPPTRTLFDALGAADFLMPLHATVIEAICVEYSLRDEEPHLCWIISSAGFPPLDAFGSPSVAATAQPIKGVYREMQCIVDAETGEWLGCGTRRVVEPRNPK